jgi:predicted RNA binding protein YcfA (HicA-like mRNA interferase family)
MPPHPILTGKQLVRILERHGFEQVRHRGSHMSFRHPDGRTTTVPMHREVPRGTLRSIMRQANLTVDDLG